MQSKHIRGIALAAAMLLWPVLARAETAAVTVGVKGTMRASLVTPEGDGPFPAILLLHTSSGLRQADLDYAQRLSQQGYVVLVPAFLDAYGIVENTRRLTFTTDAEPLYADFVAALDWLARNPHVVPGRLGAIGFSNGGYFAMWLAATGKVRAGVSQYGALNGAGTDRALTRFKNTFTKASAPVLILHGTADETVPAVAAKSLAAIVAAAGSPYELHLYDGAGHSFDRSQAPQDADAAADAWQRTLAFFAAQLKQP